MTLEKGAFEETRRDALRKIKILDTLQESAYDDITQLLVQATEAPMASISILDDERVWLKSSIGMNFQEVARDIALGTHVTLNPDEPFVITDALSDSRFSTHAYVTGDLKLRSFYGVALRTPEGVPVGAVCIADTVPRTLNESQANAVQRLARLVTSQLELRRETLCLREVAAYVQKHKIGPHHDNVIAY